MLHLIARFRSKEENIKSVKSLIKDFLEKIMENEPDTIYYESIQLDDNVSFGAGTRTGNLRLDEACVFTLIELERNLLSNFLTDLHKGGIFDLKSSERYRVQHAPELVPN